MAQVISTPGEKDRSTTGSYTNLTDSLLTPRKEFTYTYIVKAACEETEDQIKSATGVPPLKHTRDGACLVSKEIREIDSGAGLWEVDCHYDTHSDSTSVESADGPRRLVEYWVDTEMIEETVATDEEGNSLCNSVGEPFEMTRPMPIVVLNVQVVRDSFDLVSYCENYSQRVNSVDFDLGGNGPFPPRTVLCAGIRDEPVEEQCRMRRKVTYVFKINMKTVYMEQVQDFVIVGWDKVALNWGTLYREAPNDVQLVAFREKFQDSTDGGFLNLDGTRRDPLLGPLFLRFKVHLSADFNDLGIPPLF